MPRTPWTEADYDAAGMTRLSLRLNKSVAQILTEGAAAKGISRQAFIEELLGNFKAELVQPLRTPADYGLSDTKKVKKTAREEGQVTVTTAAKALDIVLSRQNSQRLFYTVIPPYELLTDEQQASVDEGGPYPVLVGEHIPQHTALVDYLIERALEQWHP